MHKKVSGTILHKRPTLHGTHLLRREVTRKRGKLNNKKDVTKLFRKSPLEKGLKSI